MTSLDAVSTYKQLQSIGFTEPQAEAIAHRIQKTEIEEQLVTRDFLLRQLEELEIRLTIKMGGIAIALGSMLIAIKYFG
jgi:hypothetical protein